MYWLCTSWRLTTPDITSTLSSAPPTQLKNSVSVYLSVQSLWKYVDLWCMFTVYNDLYVFGAWVDLYSHSKQHHLERRRPHSSLLSIRDHRRWWHNSSPTNFVLCTLGAIHHWHTSPLHNRQWFEYKVFEHSYPRMIQGDRSGQTTRPIWTIDRSYSAVQRFLGLRLHFVPSTRLCRFAVHKFELSQYDQDIGAAFVRLSEVS